MPNSIFFSQEVTEKSQFTADIQSQQLKLKICMCNAHSKRWDQGKWQNKQKPE